MADSIYVRSVNADRAIRHEEDMKRRRLKANIEADYTSKSTPSKKLHRKANDLAASPNVEASHDPTPADRSTDNSAQDEVVGKYLSARPFKAKKGDRFS
ncbi:uncharacterized protein KY384_005298 [Bacidia gigantensis]|uniref:uncharacterized protein n=1 Tax=Bacidia gigantensis TaxID=2732470 RepID=UPI001D059E09|nr:uncharacterized protein KY384_005298 [Bacidia gigantensis]KAG8529817.1 hypothetical protein KY384_005298 [Bacidia gigantensis]